MLKREVDLFQPLFFLRFKMPTFVSDSKAMKKNFTDSGIFKIISNKFVIGLVLFLAWIIFFDENSIVAHTESKQQLHDLQEQKEYYQERITSDKQKLEDLSKGKDELEKFAREQYYMSKPDEDVFIVVEEEE